MSQKSWERAVTVLALEAAQGLKRIARSPEPTKTRIARAARAVGISYWRAFDLWYGKARRIDAAEMDAIRRAEMEAARAEYRELVARIERLDAALRLSDPEFDRPLAHADRKAARRADRALD